MEDFDVGEINFDDPVIKTLLDRLPSLICVNNAEGTIKFVNRTYCDFFKSDREELVGSSIYDLIPESEHSKIQNLINTSRNNPGATSHEHRVIKPGGERGWVRWTAQPYFDGDTLDGFLAIGVDITSRIEIKEELLMKEEALENSVNAIALADPKNRIFYVNRSFMEMWQLNNRGEAVGEYPDKFHPSSVDVDELLKKIWHSEEKIVDEIPAKRPNGEIFQVKFFAAPVFKETGEPLCFMASFSDVTEEKKTEERLHRALAEKEEIIHRIRDVIESNSQTIGKLLSLQMDGKEVSLAEEGFDIFESLANLKKRLEELD